jgi:hypothetical protein
MEQELKKIVEAFSSVFISSFCAVKGDEKMELRESRTFHFLVVFSQDTEI